jgi:hypothetical protein
MSSKGTAKMTRASKAWKTLLVAAICAALPAASATAQDTGVIRGTVTDSTTHQPISGAQVQVVGSDRSAVADASGVYRLAGIAPGTVTIRVQRIGFVQRTRAVSVTSGATVAEDFSLQPIATTLSQVVVVGYGSRSRAEVTGALTTVAASDIANTPIAGVDALLQ